MAENAIAADILKESDNPELVQAESWTRLDFWSGKTPVFLIHDGGGTVFAYHCLEQLNRFVYGLRNPYFFTEEKFEGGIPEMGKLYASWIKEAVLKDTFRAKRLGRRPVDILLGGWSLGGLLSLQVAREFAYDEDIRIKGILMVDSVCPSSVKTGSWGNDSEEGKTQNQILSQRAMKEARRMVSEWELPTWEGPLEGKRPRVILLKAKEPVPPERGITSIDTNRRDEVLGWKKYDGALVEDVIEIDGHHFNIFESEHISATTRAMVLGLVKLDAPAKQGFLKRFR